MNSRLIKVQDFPSTVPQVFLLLVKDVEKSFAENENSATLKAGMTMSYNTSGDGKDGMAFDNNTLIMAHSNEFKYMITMTTCDETAAATASLIREMTFIIINLIHHAICTLKMMTAKLGTDQCGRGGTLVRNTTRYKIPCIRDK